MTVGTNLLCSVCDFKIWFKIQLGYINEANIRIGCPNCNTVLRGQFSEEHGIRFENADLESVDGQGQVIAISPEFPINRQLVNVSGVGGLTPFMAMSATFGHNVIEDFVRGYHRCKEGWESKQNSITTLCDLLRNKKYDIFLDYARKKEITDLAVDLDANFTVCSHIINQILTPVVKASVHPSYGPYYFDRLLVKKTIKNLLNRPSELSVVLAQIESIAPIEKEFNAALGIILKVMSDISSYLPILLLTYKEGFNKRYDQQYLITTVDYEDVKSLYVDLFELLSRISVIYLGFYAYAKHRDINNLNDFSGCNTLENYSGLANGRKKDVIASNTDLKNYFRFLLDSQLRNGIGHLKTEYRAHDQELIYYPFNDDRRRNVSRSISLVDLVGQIYLMYLAAFDFVRFVGKINSKLI